MAKAGSIEIDVKLNATPLEKELARQKKKLEQYEQEEVELKADQQANNEVLKQYSKEIEALKEEAEKVEKLNLTEEQRKFDLEFQEQQLQEINNKYSKNIAKQDELNEKVKKNAENQRTVANNVARLESEVGKSRGWNKMTDGLKNSDKALTKLIKKVGKYALAVFGVRSAYMAIRSAMSIISQYDEQLATDLEYIRYAVAMVLKPVMEWIISAVKTLMYYAGYIAKSWFNIDLWANSSAKGMASASKSAKEMKKTLANFDEANVLGNTSSTGGSAPTPSFDVSEWNYNEAEELENDFIKKSKNDWEELAETMREAIADPEAMKSAFGNWDTFMEGIINIALGVFDVIKGVVDTIIGLVKIIVGVFTGNFDLVKEGWDNLITGISEILYGLVEIVVGVLQGLWGIIKGLFLDIVLGIYEKVIKPIGNFFVELWDGIVRKAKIAGDGIKSIFAIVATFFKETFEKAWNGVKKLFSKGGEIFGGMKDGIVSAFKTIVNTLITGINKVINVPFNAINKFLNKIKKISFLGISPFKGLWSENPIKIPQIPKLATGGIVDVPRTGVNIGGAIAGEAGREGVLPLTNANTMAELGREIGKWITLNIDLTNTIDGRVLNKRLEQLNANKNFARNGVK